MSSRLAIVIASLALAGCTSDRLRQSTLGQASTLTDLQYQMVLSNLAMFCQNPSAMPWHISLRDGSAQVADLGALTVGGELSHTSKALPSLLGSRTVVEQWGMTPVTDDVELRVLRVAYRRAVGHPDSLSNEKNELANDLAHELKKQTPDFNEFQDQIDRTFADGKTRHRNEEFQRVASDVANRRWLCLGGLLRPGQTQSLREELANVIFPYRYTLGLYDIDTCEVILRPSMGAAGEAIGKAMCARKTSVIVSPENGILHFQIVGPDGRLLRGTDERTLAHERPGNAEQIAKLKHQLDTLGRWPLHELQPSGPRPTELREEDNRQLAIAVKSLLDYGNDLPVTSDYYGHLAKALSVVNENIILDHEELDDQFEWRDGVPIPTKQFNNYIVDYNLKNEYGYHVNLVTPFAAEIRRQVKEVQKDIVSIHTGWYHVGSKKDVPKDACYVGHYRDCYVWVGREGLEDLTQFTIKVLSFSSLIRDPTIFTTPGPRFTPASSFPTL